MQKTQSPSQAPTNIDINPQIQTQWDTHQPKTAGNTTLRSASYALTMSDHAGTHVDAFKHFGPGGTPIDEMPLEDFYTSAIALDLSHVELGAAISVREMEEALVKCGEEIKEGDTVLVYMAFNKRVHFDDPRWQHDFPGLHPDAVRWLADKGCKMFGEFAWFSTRCISIGSIANRPLGVEAISPSPEGEMNFQAHNICGERKMTHMEGLDNLDKVVGKGRFTFVGFPLKLRGGSGSPIRAVALFDQ